MNYHDDFSHVSKSMLDLFLRSRQEYYLTYVTRDMSPKQPTRPMIAGTVLHSVLLEGFEFDDVVQCYPADVLKCNGDLDGKKATALRREQPDVLFVKESEFESLRAVYDGVAQDERLASILEAATHREQRVDAVLNGLPCKCKPDIACDIGNVVACYDLKFMENVDPDSWRRSSRRFRYWLQDSHYSACLEAAWGKPVSFRFACIEVKFPYRVQWYWYDQSSRETARIEHAKALEELAACQESGNWADVWESVCVLNPWEISASEDSAEVQCEA